MTLSEHFRDLPISTDFPLASADDWTEWAATVRSTLRGRRLLGHLDGSTLRPPASGVDDTAEIRNNIRIAQDIWDAHDEQIVAFIVASVDRSLRPDLEDIRSAALLWEHLTNKFIKSSRVREYQLLTQASAARQGDRTIQEFATLMRGYWHELLKLEGPGPDSIRARTCRERLQLFQFLMALRPEFQPARDQIIRNNISLDVAINELTAEETHLQYGSTVTPRRGSLHY